MLEYINTHAPELKAPNWGNDTDEEIADRLGIPWGTATGIRKTLGIKTGKRRERKKRFKKVVDYLLSDDQLWGNEMTAGIYMALTGVIKRTAHEDLNHFTDEGLLTKDTSARTYCYHLVKDLDAINDYIRRVNPSYRNVYSYRRNSDDNLRDLERSVLNDPSLHPKLEREQQRAGVPSTYRECSLCENYVVEVWLCADSSVGVPCKNLICQGCLSVSTYSRFSSSVDNTVICPEHAIRCEDCETLMTGASMNDTHIDVYRCDSCTADGNRSFYCGNCWSNQNCDRCGNNVCNFCEFTTCADFVDDDGEFHRRCGGSFCLACTQIHDCTS